MHRYSSLPRSRPAALTSLLAVGMLSASALLAGGCTSTPPPAIDPFAAADEARRHHDLLDEPVTSGHTRRAVTNPHAARPDDAITFVPEAPSELSKAIDADAGDWDLSRARRFDERRHVERGEEFWSGPADAGFRVAVDADEGFVYLFVEVTDDEVVVRDPREPVDAVVLWLRDPQLENLLGSLPDSYRRSDRVRPETALLFTPDGRFVRYGGSTPVPDGAVVAAGRPTDSGYVLEVALRLEAMPQLARLPVTELAFRVDLHDGDDPNRAGAQTTMSMLPDTGEDVPRFALFDVAMYPHAPIAGQPPRPDAIGAWQLGPEGWTYRSIELAAGSWAMLDDPGSVRSQMSDTAALPGSCRDARNDLFVVEAFQAASGQHRVALALCGPNPERGRCTASSQTDLVWFHMVPDGERWQVRTAIEVFAEPLSQCLLQRADGRPFHHRFSMVPTPVVTPSMWAVGWSKELTSRAELIDEAGVTFVDPQSPAGRVGEARTHRTTSIDQFRSVRRSQVFLTAIDDAAGLDLCEVEHSDDQECTGLGTGCRPHPHGRTVVSHIKTWNPRSGVFEPYLLSKHPRCSGQTRFENVEGFMLLHVNQRLGLLPAGK